MTGPLKDRSLLVRLNQLELQVAAFSRQLRAQGDRMDRWVWPKQVRLAKTTHSAESYPAAPANCYEIEFLDGTFTEAAGQQTPTYTDRGSLAYALSMAGEYFLEGTRVAVVRIGRQWWIMFACGQPRKFWRFTLNESFSGSPSAAGADLLELDGTDTGQDVTVYDYLDVFSADLTTDDVGYCVQQGDIYLAIQAPCPPEA